MWINFTSNKSNLVDLSELSIRILANFYGTEQVDEFQGKE